MSAACSAPIPWSRLVDYWAGEVDGGDALEEHLFGCAACTAESARVAALTETFRGMVPLLLTPARLEQLTVRLDVRENRMVPGERKEVAMPRRDLLVHRLGGLDLRRAARVSFTLRPEGSEHVMVSHRDAPFDRERGEVLVACQPHFAVLPPDTVAEVRVHDEAGTESLATYTILHRPASD